MRRITGKAKDETLIELQNATDSQTTGKRVRFIPCDTLQAHFPGRSLRAASETPGLWCVQGPRSNVLYGARAHNLLVNESIGIAM